MKIKIQETYYEMRDDHVQIIHQICANFQDYYWLRNQMDERVREYRAILQFIDNRISTENEVLEHYCKIDDEQRHQKSRIELLEEIKRVVKQPFVKQTTTTQNGSTKT